MTTVLPRSIFRAYDIRGVVPTELNSETVTLIARAIGTEIVAKNQTRVLIARDGRLSSPELKMALSQGLCDCGLEVIDLGQIPTPVLYFATNTLGINSGVMLTGSHNPANHNGLKIVIDGETLSESAIDELYQRCMRQEFISGTGFASSQSILELYVEDIAKRLTLKRPLKVVIDCGNGVTGVVAIPLFERLGVECIPLFCEVDGRFPNHHPDPTDASTLTILRERVLLEKADCGLAFDGDGDRIGVVTETGEIIAADRLMIVFAKALLKDHPGSLIIYDVKCTSALPQVITECGGIPMMWKTGHSLIKAKMREERALFAGEMSGHLFFKEGWYGFDDGLYVGARFLSILAGTEQTASSLFADPPARLNTPELKIHIAETRKFSVIADLQSHCHFDNATVYTLDGVRAEFSDGWGLIRASNTTPYLIARFEAVDAAAMEKIQMRFRELILAVEPGIELPF